MRYEVSQEGAAATLHLRGELVLADRDGFDGAVRAALKPGVASVTVDLSGLEYMDSAGLGMLLTLREAAEDLGTRVVLRGAAGEVKELLEMARFDTLFDLV